MPIGNKILRRLSLNFVYYKHKRKYISACVCEAERNTPPRTKQDIIQYLKSLDYFLENADEKQVDVALSNHTVVDNGLERIAYSKARWNYMPNIYVIGRNGFQKYCQVFRTISYDVLAE